MLSIGEFSKICGVTTRTLRHYDTIGLIKPTHINPDTGYRFYEVSQIRQLLLINRLKGYHFSLEEIAAMVSMYDNHYILNQITSKKNEIQLKIEHYKLLENQLKFDILNLERGVDIMSFIDDIEVTLVETKPQHILYSRQLMSVDDYCKYIGKLFELAHSSGMQFAGAPMSIYHDKEFDPANNDTEVALPVEVQNQHTRLLAGGLCATATCKGAYSNLPNSYAKLTEWINENGYDVTSAPYEQYLKGPMESQSADDYITQIFFPVKKR
ncbi:MerR family transcriptional regulator [Pelosinus sp. IPA-1]|uniref:MerR family transcriptional regulator n=1 Tax=Pelosinus sp. IPA-1 TaxID=3029569 RepID=UPI002436267F|nr:MerR family transcriptional regulator [Pelosinus sp. IPA-1]GMA97989.1 MerR family transcriptional regulator [Pelosinus sp. IPA-1]